MEEEDVGVEEEEERRSTLPQAVVVPVISRHGDCKSRWPLTEPRRAATQTSTRMSTCRVPVRARLCVRVCVRACHSGSVPLYSLSVAW